MPSFSKSPKTSNFHKDVNGEQTVSLFLDKFFYGACHGIKGFERISDKETQKKGVDVLCKFHGNQFKTEQRVKIDEKAALYYAVNTAPGSEHKPLKTFAFELENQASGNIGWFLNNDLETTHYLLIWIWFKNTDDIKRRQFNLEQIEKLEVMLIDKKAFKKQLQTKYRIDDKYLESLISNKNLKPISKHQDCNDIRFIKSSNIVEQPLNMVVNKSILKMASSIHIYVSKTGLIRAN